MGKRIIAYILLLPTIAAILASVLCMIAAHTVFMEGYMKKSLARSNYYEETYNVIMENFKNNTIQSGLTEDVLDGIITIDEVTKDVDKVVEYIYHDVDKPQIDIEGIQERLNANIQKQIEANNKTVTKEEQEEINTYVNVIVSIYKAGITYADSSINEIKAGFLALSKYFDMARVVIYTAAVVLLLVVFLLTKRDFIGFFSSSLFASGVLLITFRQIFVTVINVNTLLLFNQAFSDMLINVINSILSITLTVGIAECVVGLILAISNRKKVKKV